MNDIPVPPLPYKPPRPASHWCAIVLFGFISAGFTMILVNAYIGRNRGSLWGMPVLAALQWLGLVAFIALVAGERRLWAYYIGATCLLAWSIRGLQTAWYVLSSDASPSPEIQLYRVATCWAAPLLVLLFFRFAFGAPSRRYFGLPTATQTRPIDAE